MTCARRFAVGMISLVTLVVPISAAGQTMFEGVYIANGVDSAGTKYRRAVSIERDGDQFAVTWVASRVVGEAIVLEPIWVGVGVAVGDTLSVSFVATDTFGIVVYQAGTDTRQFSGRWALAGDNGLVHLETLTRLPDTALDPDGVEPPEDPTRVSEAFSIMVPAW